MNIHQYNDRRNISHRFRYSSSLSTKNATYNNNTLDNNSLSKYHAYEQKLLSFLEGIKANKIKYKELKILFEYEDNFKLVCDIYQKYLKSKIEKEILNFYIKSLGNFISLIHSDEPMEQLDKTINTVNKYLRVRKYHKNTILFRIGDIGTKYYILLNGKAYTLVPKKFTKSMTFDQYRNHLKILYIFGEDYLLEQTMHCNIQSCDIAFSDIETNENKMLRSLYNSNYTCNYSRYIKIINGDEHIMVEDFDLGKESEEEENKEDEDNEILFNDDDNEDDKESSDDDDEIEEEIIEKERLKHKNSTKKIKNFNFSKINKNNEKTKKIFNYFNKYFGSKVKNKNIANSQPKAYSNNYKEETQTNNTNSQNEELFIKRKDNDINKRKLRKIDTIRANKFDEINSFNIGIPKELLIKDKYLSPKKKYDGGELPTFFTRTRSKYVFFDEDKEEDEEEKKEEIEKENQHYKNLIYNFRLYSHYKQVKNAKRNFIIVGYGNVATLSSGMSFGEISLLNENHKRSSTIFIDDESIIGRLNLGEYNATIKTVRAKIRTDSINFLLSIKLFGEISFSYFLNKYWIYFQCKKNTKGDFLFKIGEECKTLYIIYSGEIKLSAYIDKDNINELIKGIKHDKAKKINFYLNKTQFLNNNNNNSIFERKQKYCLMIGKKGDILGLSDIINFRNNKYICEAEVMTDSLSYYEIKKSLIFNKVSNDINSSIKNRLNVENMKNLIKLKQEFMLDKLKNIKTTIEHRYKYLNLDEINNVPDNNNNTMKVNNLDSINNARLNNNHKSLSLNSISVDNEKHNKNVCCNHNEKQIISKSFIKCEKLKESISNIITNHQTFNQSKLSENNNINHNKGHHKILSLNINKTTINTSINFNQVNFNTTTEYSKKTIKVNVKQITT